VAWRFIWSAVENSGLDSTTDTFPEEEVFTGDEAGPEANMDTLTVAEAQTARANLNAQATELAEGRHVAGIDFEPGRYTIAAWDPEDYAWINIAPAAGAPAPADFATFVGWEDRLQAPVSATATLPRTTVLTVSGSTGVTLTPVATVPPSSPTSLGPGAWMTGEDLLPGVYRVAAAAGTSGAVYLAGPPQDGLESGLRDWSWEYLDWSGDEYPQSAEFELDPGWELVVECPSVTLTRLS
jgi:hypothetical protein